MGNRMLRIVAILLALCLLLSGCSQWDTILKELRSSMYPQDSQRIYIRFSDMVYERPDPEVFQQELEKLRQGLKGDADLGQVVDHINRFYALFDEFYTNLNLADIHYCKDLTDSYWEQEYQFCSQSQPAVEAALDELYRTLAASRFRKTLEGDNYFGEGFFAGYDSESFWDETFTALTEEEYRLQNRYYELSSQALGVEPYSEEYFTKYGTEMAQLFVELIAVRQKIAQYLGYDSYVDFAYENYYYRNYTPQQAEQYFRQIGKELNTVYCAVNGSQAWDAGSQFCTEKETFAYVKDAAQRMGGTVAEAFRFLDKAQLYDISYGENKYNASFEVYLDSYGEPFVFTSPALQGSDKLVFAHEFGHFANDFVCGGSYAGTDVSEVHSGAMEYLSLLYSEDAQALEKYKLADSLCVFVEQSAYALFEQEVYALSGVKLTVENVQKLYTDICTDFGFDSWAWDCRDYVTIPHFFTNPMYIASYVVSNDLAFQIYQKEKAEPGAGLKIYEACLESEDSNIMQFAMTYRLEMPFADQRVASVRKTFEDELLP